MTPLVTPGSENGSPYGGPEVGAEAPPPPPPPPLNALGNDVADLRREVHILAEAFSQFVSEPTPKPSKREPLKLVAQARQLPKRYAVPLCIAAATIGTVVGIEWGTPEHNTAQVASMAKADTLGEVVPWVESELAANRADATQVVVPDPFSYYGRELTEDSKTAIGYDATTGNKTLNPARSMVVANQVKEALSQRSMTLDEMRLSSIGPTQLRVHNNPAEGYQLFAPPAVRPPDSMTTTTAATATSAP